MGEGEGYWQGQGLRESHVYCESYQDGFDQLMDCLDWEEHSEGMFLLTALIDVVQNEGGEGDDPDDHAVLVDGVRQVRYLHLQRWIRVILMNGREKMPIVGIFPNSHH